MKKSYVYTNLKIVHDLDRIKQMREGKIVPPKTVRVDLNTVCNHRCSFCLYQSINDGLKGVGLNDEMPFGTQIDDKRFIELIDEFKECGVNSLVFLGGGEPTIHQNLEKVIEATNSSGLDYGIITNGSRLDRIIPYKNSPGFKWVRVSLDAAKEETWIKIHRPLEVMKYGFEHILNTIKNLKNERVDFLIGISFIVGKQNYQEVYDFIKLGKDLGVDNVRIGLEYGKGFGQRNIDIILLALEQIKKGKKDFETDNFKIFDKVSERKKDISTDRDYSTCGFKELSTNLGADLNLYTCCFGKYTNSHKIGSLKEMSFKELWFNHRKEFLKKFDISKCPPCWYGEINRILEYITQKDALHSNFID
jgi:MoaA/NifB/PqqE/SkfB family radical SAM enzyme